MVSAAAKPGNTSTPSRSRDLRAADNNAARTLSFQGLGMNLVAMTSRLRHWPPCGASAEIVSAVMASAIALERVITMSF